MDRRSRSIESPRRHRNGMMNNSRGGSGGRNSRRDYQRFSRSRSRSRNRSREREYRRRSRSRERAVNYRRGGSFEKDLYRDIINDDYQEEMNSYHGGNRGGSSGNVGGARNYEDVFNEERERFWNERARVSRGREYERDLRGRECERDPREREFERDYDRDYERAYQRAYELDHELDYRDREYERDNMDRRDHRNHNNFLVEAYHEQEHDDHSDVSDISSHDLNNKPNATLLAYALQPHITGADLTSALVKYGSTARSIRLIRNTKTGASRGFAFVEFHTVEEAEHWMELTQKVLVLPDKSRAKLCYCKDTSKQKSGVHTDWYCGKCSNFNFRRRDTCFKCLASRKESEKGGEGCDEISNILTKKIMLRNLDVLTNEEGVLTALQQHVPDLAKRISKIVVSRDPLTQTSRGVCYLNFDTLVDSMNVHNALSGIEPPLKIDNREVIVTYCIDHENREIIPKSTTTSSSEATGAPSVAVGPLTAADMAALTNATAPVSFGEQYTLKDVPRLAEYSADMYATTPEEQAYFLKYYHDYYMSEITKGQYKSLPSKSQLEETSANSAAAVALSAIQRKQKKMSGNKTTAKQAAAAVKAALTVAQTIVTPRGNDGKTYPPPDVSLYQYDETSGYYYDPTTGLYYNAHSQYYYNKDTGAYLYWDQRKSTYVLATPAAVAATVQDAVKTETGEDLNNKASSADDNGKKDGSRKEGKHDKVKVAKKIVKDMEKWAKQLNQKKDYTVVATPQPLLPSSDVVFTNKVSASAPSSSGYADVCFSILEKKERPKLADFSTKAPAPPSKLVSAYGSDSEDEHVAAPSKSAAPPTPAQNQSQGEASEKDYVDFQKLTCLLCKRAFQSLEILTKHLKMSNLHKENLHKYNLGRASAPANTDSDGQGDSALSYRDRAKERRLKYGESNPPPPNHSRERFEKAIKKLNSSAGNNVASVMPIGSNNIGNRLLQKMGWSEGQGLGRKNQGRTNIIEADTRTTTAGLGNRSGGIPAGDDYNNYIKRMMKTRYESV